MAKKSHSLFGWLGRQIGYVKGAAGKDVTPPKIVYADPPAGVPPIHEAFNVMAVAVFDCTTPVLEPAVTCAPTNWFAVQVFVVSVSVVEVNDVPFPLSRGVYVTPAPVPESLPAGTLIVKLLALRGVEGLQTWSMVMVVAVFETTVPEAVELGIA